MRPRHTHTHAHDFCANLCGTQFTRYTRTKVQILTVARACRNRTRDAQGKDGGDDTHFTCFTGRKVQILTQKARPETVRGTLKAKTEETILTLLALLVEKYKY
jgi:hypothetical protein